MTVTRDTPLTDFPGVGEARAKKLEKLGLSTAGDLLTCYPRDYEDRRKVYAVAEAPLEGRVCIAAMAAEHPRLSRIRKGLELVQVKVVDHTGALHLTFFNQGYVERAIRAGEEYIFYGAVEVQGRRRSMVNPIFERTGRQSFTGCIMPVYRLTAGISNHMLASLARQALPCAEGLPETLPQHIRQAHSLAAAEFSLKNIHFPEDEKALDLARRRLAFEELFYLAVGLHFLKSRRGREGAGTAIAPRSKEDFLRLLPFAPTAAQSRVMDEVAADMSSGQPMNRLVQGDVGSGKTMVAAACCWFCWKNGRQSALMAPTEILAEQHFRGLSPLLEGLGMRLGLLTGSCTAKEKRLRKAALEAGELDLVIGTHALITGDTRFADLGLVVTDEQHRFGVAQRMTLSGKGEGSNVLVMSATPIPRTLALIIYGDLELSVIDELPPGRQKISTYYIGSDKRQRAFGYIRKHLDQGYQGYIVCPLVEEDPEGEDTARLKAAVTYMEELARGPFAGYRLGLLHGRMKGKEKDAAMAAFAAGEIQLLISTTVIEVGVDVPNAVIMMVENAERFGLSQLHQLRGRVGRGRWQSYCVLISDNRTQETRERLRYFCQTNDGFKIAEKDLELRGPGDFFGQRQHGLPVMKAADLAGDTRVLKEAQEAAEALLRDDPTLSTPRNRPVLEKIRRLFAEDGDIFN